MKFYKKSILMLFLFNFNIILNTEINTQPHTKIFIIGIPKCGTWLLDKFINLSTKKENGLYKFYFHGILRKRLSEENAIQLFNPSEKIFNHCLKNLSYNEYLISHLIYDRKYEELLKKNNFKVVFIIRDPRDQLISRIFYTYNYPKPYAGLQHLSFDELLSGLIGAGALPNQKFDDLISSHLSYLLSPEFKAISRITDFYETFLPWSKSSMVYTTRFEDIVGPNGGGSLRKQIEEINNISKFLNLNLTQEKICEITSQLFGGTNTFREGKLGKWKEYFKPHHIDEFKKIGGHLLIELGYEKDLNW